MERARSATAYCIDQLMATDRYSVVVFDDQIELLVPSQPVENRGLSKSAFPPFTQETRLPFIGMGEWRHAGQRTSRCCRR